MKKKKVPKKPTQKQNRSEETIEKRAIASILGGLFVMVIVVLSLLTYNIWLDKKLDKNYADIEINTKDIFIIDKLIGNKLYLKNNFNKEINITNIAIGKNNCNIIKNINPGMNEINIGNCAEDLDKNPKEIIIYTNEGIFSKYEIIKNNNLYKKGALGNCDQLLKIKDNLSGKYFLTKNLYCFETKEWNNNEGFIPIGNQDTPFTGTLNGDGYTVYGININSSENYIGVFGKLKNATIEDITFLVNNIHGGRYTGALAGHVSNSIIRNVHIQGSVSSDEKYSAGFIGYLTNSSVLECSFSQGDVYSEEKYVGGLIGYQKDSTINNSYSTGIVIGTESYTGGLIGYQENSILQNSYSTGSVISNEEDYIGGLIGYTTNSQTTSSYWDINSSNVSNSASGIGKTTNEMFNKTTYTNWDFENIWNFNNNYPTLK
jgi:hypothetical protein